MQRQFVIYFGAYEVQIRKGMHLKTSIRDPTFPLFLTSNYNDKYVNMMLTDYIKQLQIILTT